MTSRRLALAGLISVSMQSPLLPRDNSTNAISFKDVPITKDIQWTPCFNNYTCVNLEVPLDYENLEAGTTNVAFIKYSAPNQPAMGDVIFNPGGPGGSAVEFVQDPVTLELITSRLGSNYNIIGMDPRGVGNSGPLLDCFGGNNALRDYFFNQVYLTKYYPRNSPDMKYTLQEAGAFGEWCSKTLDKNAIYANTPATARDMLQYFEKLAESQDKPAEEAKVELYGVSYGTTLGMTFAQLYPDRVGRFIIDGVMDLDDHYGGSWSTNLRQGDEAVHSFNTFCFEAGPKCPFYRNDSSPDAIKQRVDAILADMEENPIPVSDPYWVQYPTVVNHIDLLNAIMIIVYSPMASFPILALGLSDLEQRNGSILAASKAVMPAATCDNTSLDYSARGSLLAIACNDASGRFNVSTTEEWDDYVQDLTDISSYLGPVWARVVSISCRNFELSPPESQVWNGYKVTETSNPILFVTNTIDPVTSSYDKMAALFSGSVILKQEAVGHGVMAAKSECTTNYMTKFIETGELPPADTLCEVSPKNPFDQTPEKVETKMLLRRSLPFKIYAS